MYSSMEEKTRSKQLYEVPTVEVVEVNPEGNLLTVSNPPQWDNEDM